MLYKNICYAFLCDARDDDDDAVCCSCRVCARVLVVRKLFHYKDRNSLFFPRSVVLEISPGLFASASDVCAFSNYQID